MCRNSFASHRLRLNALSLRSCFRAFDPAFYAVQISLPRAVNCATAEIAGVLFKERCLIKRTILRWLICRSRKHFLLLQRHVDQTVPKLLLSDFRVFQQW
jgi:hypothetical protein